MNAATLRLAPGMRRSGTGLSRSAQPAAPALPAVPPLAGLAVDNRLLESAATHCVGCGGYRSLESNVA